MGRRALRNNYRNLDLSNHLLETDDLPQPWNAASIFGRTAPLEIEIGSGKGMFLKSAAQQFPERNFLGIEIARKYTYFTAARLLRAGVANARIIHGDARPIFSMRIPDNSVDTVHVYFPDPWWKRRHKNRRVMDKYFVKEIQRTLVPGGQLHFWTDVEEYFQASMKMMDEETQLSGPFEVAPRDPEHDLDYRTHFERRMRLHGQNVYRALFEKSGVPAAAESVDKCAHVE
jgi:tRNA (guanine-N7-)-methyltransferase